MVSTVPKGIVFCALPFLTLSLIHIYDYGQMGVELKNNIKQYWWQSMVLLHENIVGIDSAIDVYKRQADRFCSYDAFVELWIYAKQRAL